MRAYEILSEQQRQPIELRRLNAIKHHQRTREASFARRRKLVAVMYRDLERDVRELELEKARLELEQTKSELSSPRVDKIGKAVSPAVDLAKAPAQAIPAKYPPNGR